ncbi:hypothetical protein GOODEAATRI_019577 [Goodea atripinnis]|uniref:Uncharacterized protein n=1 Tax=Goodea atripinnis TaxID=208336 RepID=A0ABV0MTG9_9TELE
MGIASSLLWDCWNFVVDPKQPLASAQAWIQLDMEPYVPSYSGCDWPCIRASPSDIHIGREWPWEDLNIIQKVQGQTYSTWLVLVLSKDCSTVLFMQNTYYGAPIMNT